MRQKVFAYVVRERAGRPELLVFSCPLEPGLQVPKGSIEPGERPEEAVLRELREESGLAAAIRRGLGAAIFRPPWGGPAEEQHFFLLEAAGPAPDSWVHEVGGAGGDAGERYEFQWLALDDAGSSPLVQGADRMLAALRAALAD